MARRKRKRNGNIQPAVKELWFVVPNTNPESTFDPVLNSSYIDLSLCASILNRRFYRQGLNWAVAGFTFFTPVPGTGNIQVLKLPDTWVMKNSWVKTRALWREMNEQVLETEESIEGKYADFKVQMDVEMLPNTIQCSANPGGRILTPIVTSGSTNLALHTTGDFVGGIPEAEWDYSTVVIPNDPVPGTPTTYDLHVIGGNAATSKGIIEGYSHSRARPQETDPNVPADPGWMNELFDVGETHPEIRADLVDDNDQAPYPVGFGADAFYPGSDRELEGLVIHDSVNFTSTTVSGKVMSGGNNFPCGLIRINNAVVTSPPGSPVLLKVQLVPGRHRGYLAEKMEDF